MQILRMLDDIFGLAAASSSVNDRAMASGGRSTVWKMTKGELHAALDQRKIAYRESWTVPELRSIFLENDDLTKKTTSLGLSRMTMADLVAKCRKEEIAIPEKPTKGLLMRLLRDSIPPDSDEEVIFGRYRGYTYKEVPADYMQWAAEEAKVNPNKSADLERISRTGDYHGNEVHSDGSGSDRFYTPASHGDGISPEGVAEGAEGAPCEEDPSGFRRERLQPGGEGHRDRDRGVGGASAAATGLQGQGNSEGHQVGGLSKSAQKRKAYWAKRADYFGKKKKKAREDLMGTDAEESTSTEEADESTSESVRTIGAGGDYEGEEAPRPGEDGAGRQAKVKLLRGDDQETVRNLPSWKMKRAARKRVHGWATKVYTALWTTIAGLANPFFAEVMEVVVDPARDLVTSSTCWRPCTSEVTLLELFAGSSHMTAEFARRGHSVLEPRDIRLGHDLRLAEEQESVFEDIRTHQPLLLWIALPCTKWSPWQRLNYKHRPRELAKERRRERKLVDFAVQCAKMQLDAGRDVAFEHPQFSDMWEDRSLQDVMADVRTETVDFDMCQFGLRATTDGQFLRKPTRVLTSHNGIRWMLRNKKCVEILHMYTPRRQEPIPDLPESTRGASVVQWNAGTRLRGVPSGRHFRREFSLESRASRNFRASHRWMQPVSMVIGKGRSIA